ncbi:pif-1 [Matsumuraeses phaseoli granulovirus]|uniref:Pif-1 n=1 Tax=Matsumuraeses phaseoli granulovirus TaxID=2760664 RepID=A0AAE7SXQ2_9BBAC|nr:pif-1 [Matsumuraeses phaseoli granulovirus]QOD40028.1 pif-1 [Matsumuraeses phaseoli granulovirus]
MAFLDNNYYVLMFLSIIVLCLVLAHNANMNLFTINANAIDNLRLYDNSEILLLDPPKEIIINENELSCHETPTPCTSNADCQLCREGLAACYQFNDTVILEIAADKQFVINAGERYCLAMDNRSARSCNPNTGTWLMRQVDGYNFALICHCNTPGLVTQLNIYEDCTLPVGCKPHGVIANINTNPLMCTCENGYVAELSETNTPYCRPKLIRDIILDPSFFHRPPCRDGYLSADHPAFNTVYRTQIGANICLPDPCSIDPLTGERHDGRVVYESNGGADGGPLIMCQCNISDELYPVYNPSSMLDTQYRQSDWEIANACLKPLLVSRRDIRSDLKVFWARDSLKSDADMVFQVNTDQVKEPYRVLLQRRLTAHPNVSLSTEFVLKFQLSSAYVASSINSPQRDVFQGYWQLCDVRRNNNNCALPGIGLCRPDINCGNVTCTTYNCIDDRTQATYRSQCYLFRVMRTFDDVGSVGHVCVWNTPSYYNNNNVPVTFYMNALGATDGGYGVALDVRRLFFTNTRETVDDTQLEILNQLLTTYPLYSS